MKILQAFDFLSLPHGGGTVDIVYKLSEALAQRGHSVTICTGNYEHDPDYLHRLTEARVVVKMCRSYFNRHGIYLMPGLVRLDIKDYDVIHLHCYRSLQNIMLFIKATAYGIPYIIDAHGSTVPHSGRKTSLLDVYDSMYGRALIEHAKYVIAETAVGVAEWEKLGASRVKIRVQHPLLDTSEFDRLPERGLFRQAYGLGDYPIILFLGRIHQAKGIDTLLHSFCQIARNRESRLVIAGQDDGYKDTLVRLATEMNIRDKIAFVGHISGRVKLGALVDADMLVQPSRNEAGVRPSLEAIMCHTPVIVSRNTGAGNKIAEFDGGLLFNCNSDQELASAIQEILNNPVEASARTKKAREYILDTLSLEKQIGQYEQLYWKAMQ